jgi:hypothetical protein
LQRSRSSPTRAATFPGQINEALDLLRKGLKNAFDKSYAGCLRHDVGQVKRFVAVGRFAAQLGAGIGEDEIATKLANCLRFRLDLVLHLERTGTQTHDHVLLDASSTAQPLTFDQATGGPTGDLPWTVDDWDWDDRICFKDGGDATPVTPAHAKLSIDVNLVVTHLPSGATTYKSDPPKLALTLDPGFINTRSQCAVDAGGDPATANGGSANRWFTTTMRSQFGTFGVQTLNPFTTWSYQGREFPWATAFAESVAPTTAACACSSRTTPRSEPLAGADVLSDVGDRRASFTQEIGCSSASRARPPGGRVLSGNGTRNVRTRTRSAL